jgi:hypothetical protein
MVNFFKIKKHNRIRINFLFPTQTNQEVVFIEKKSEDSTPIFSLPSSCVKMMDDDV